MRKSTKYWLTAVALAVIAILLIIKLSAQGTSTGAPGPITDKDWTWGNKDSKIVVIEYSDFQCPGCRQAWMLTKELQQEFGDKILFAYRYFPLEKIHNNANSSAWAAEAAGKQGKFWEMYDILFGYQSDWEKETDPQAKFEKYATGLGLNIEKFKQDYASGTIKNRVSDSLKEAEALDLGGTPTFFLNGELVKPLSSLKTLIREQVTATPQK